MFFDRTLSKDFLSIGVNVPVKVPRWIGRKLKSFISREISSDVASGNGEGGVGGGKVASGVDIDILAISSPCLKSSAVGGGGGEGMGMVGTYCNVPGPGTLCLSTH